MPSQSFKPLRDSQGEQKVKYTFIKSKRVEALVAMKACMMVIQQTPGDLEKTAGVKGLQKNGTQRVKKTQ